MIAPVLSTTYQSVYLSRFGYNYSLYFDLSDPFLILYNEGIVFVVLLVLISPGFVLFFMIPGQHSWVEKKGRATNQTYLSAVAVIAVIAFLYFLFMSAFMKLSIVDVLILTAVVVGFCILILIGWKNQAICIFLAAISMNCVISGVSESKRVISDSKSFNVIMNDSTFVMREGDKEIRRGFM